MLFPAEGIENRKDNSPGQQNCRDRTDQQPDAHQGAVRLDRSSSLIASQFQHHQRERDSNGIGYLSHQRDQAVEHALMALIGFPFIPFDRIRNDGPGHHLGSADADASHHTQHKDHPEWRFR